MSFPTGMALFWMRTGAGRWPNIRYVLSQGRTVATSVSSSLRRPTLCVPLSKPWNGKNVMCTG